MTLGFEILEFRDFQIHEFKDWVSKNRSRERELEVERDRERERERRFVCYRKHTEYALKRYFWYLVLRWTNRFGLK